MAVKKYKPVTPGMRDMTGYTFEEITKSTPERSLLVTKQNYGGRNAQGRVTVRHRGGGGRRMTLKASAKHFPFFQVFTPPHRESIALEPMTCNVDAFNNGQGLVSLAADKSWKAGMEVVLER